MKGKSLIIEGTGTTHPMSGTTYNTHISVEIDDPSLIESHKATINKLELVTDLVMIDYAGYTSTTTGQATLTAAKIPMDEDKYGMRYWMGSGVTGYSYNYTTTYGEDKTNSGSLSLVDNPANCLEVWIQFKDGKKARAVFR